MTSLAWRSLLTPSLPLALALGACPSDDSPPPDDTGPASTSTDPSTSGSPSTGPDDTSTGAADSSSGSTAAATTEPMTSSSSSGSSESGGATTGEIAVCGNNVIEGDEACDLGQVNGETCQSLGYQGGQLGCLLNCEGYNLLGCFICGNGTVDIAEDCESVVPDDVTCESLGYEAGTITCGADCLFDLAECSICGDGVQQGPEDCDGIDYGGNDCASIGFDGGNLSCNLASCTYNVSGCSGGQYVQDFEVGVMPPEFTLGGTSGFVVNNTMPINGTFSAHNADINDSQSSTMSLTALFGGPGTVTFSHRESTESSFDYLEFWVDGAMLQEWSGSNATQMYMTNVAAGMHTLEWRYTKDGSVSSGSDTVWVDDIQLVPGVPI